MNIDQQIAKATSERYAHETAKAQVAYDLKVFTAIGSEEFNDGEFQLYADREWRWLKFCKEKATEWAIKAGIVDIDGEILE